MRRKTAILMLLITLTAYGCYSYRLHAPNKVGVTTQQEVVWSFAWGLVQEQPKIENCNDQALAEVTVKSNLAYDFLTVMTLGFASPKKVEWKCAPPEPTTAIALADTTKGD